MGKSIQTMLLMFAYLMGMVLCAAVPVYEQQVSGTVTDEETGEPIPGANIYISELQTGAATDAEGMYEITNIEPGTYSLTASYVGYEEYETTFDISADE